MPHNGAVDHDSIVDGTPTRWWNGVQQCWTTENPHRQRGTIAETEPVADIRSFTAEQVRGAVAALEANQLSFEPAVPVWRSASVRAEEPLDSWDTRRSSSVRAEGAVRYTSTTWPTDPKKGLHHKYIELPNRAGYRVLMKYGEDTLYQEDFRNAAAAEEEVREMYSFLRQ